MFLPGVRALSGLGGVRSAGLAAAALMVALAGAAWPARGQRMIGESCVDNPRPVIMGPRNVWDFGGQSPAGYPTQITLTATGGGGPPYSFYWTGSLGPVAGGPPNSATFAGAWPGSAKVGDAIVTVVTGCRSNAKSAPFHVTVRTPWAAVPLAVPPDEPDPGDRADKQDAHWWYVSHIPYEVEDQFGKPLGKDLPVSENWSSKLIIRCIDCNWRRTPPGGSPGTGNGGVITDRIKGQTNFIKELGAFVPAHPVPQCPRNDCADASFGNRTVQVHCWVGTVSVGSANVGQGLAVMDLTWRRFQDHARHCNIITGNYPSPLKPCTCPGSAP
jgi:hypothetical protein